LAGDVSVPHWVERSGCSLAAQCSLHCLNYRGNKK
jgi:hypothetical protein